jgi:hypothetical protein
MWGQVPQCLQAFMFRYQDWRPLIRSVGKYMINGKTRYTMLDRDETWSAEEMAMMCNRYFYVTPSIRGFDVSPLFRLIENVVPATMMGKRRRDA